VRCSALPAICFRCVMARAILVARMMVPCSSRMGDTDSPPLRCRTLVVIDLLARQEYAALSACRSPEMGSTRACQSPPRPYSRRPCSCWQRWRPLEVLCPCIITRVPLQSPGERGQPAHRRQSFRNIADSPASHAEPFPRYVVVARCHVLRSQEGRLRMRSAHPSLGATRYSFDQPGRPISAADAVDGSSTGATSAIDVGAVRALMIRRSQVMQTIRRIIGRANFRRSDPDGGLDFA
jgi:hypothetical protein